MQTKTSKGKIVAYSVLLRVLYVISLRFNASGAKQSLIYYIFIYNDDGENYIIIKILSKIILPMYQVLCFKSSDEGRIEFASNRLAALTLIARTQGV